MKNKKEIAIGGQIAADETKELKVKGLAIVYEQEGDIGAGHHEIIKRGAAKKALERNDNTYLLWHHDRALPLASVKSGTLKLKETNEGVEVEARIPDTEIGRHYYSLIQSGRVSNMSFNLVTSKDAWHQRGSKMLHVVNEIEKIPEVSITGFPAFEGTEICARSIPPIADEIKEIKEMAAEPIEETIILKKETNIDITNGGKIMNTTEEINIRMAAITEAQDAILKGATQRGASGGDATLNEDEQKEFDAFKDEIKSLEARTLTLQNLEAEKS